MSDLIRLFTNSTVASPRGGQDFVHFWFYPLLATPGVWLTRAVGMSPTYAFVLLNVTLLGAALWLALPRLGGAACLLLFAGPIIWWIDKTHTEAFTFALLTIVFLYLRERPYWALISAGAASTQNPPIAAVWVLVLLAGLIDGAHRRSSGQFWLGAAAGATLAALHPLYFGVRYGTPSLLLRGTAPGLPGLPEINVTVSTPAWAWWRTSPRWQS